MDALIVQVFQWAFGLVITILLLYMTTLMRSFGKSVERLERHTERLSKDMGETRERLARVETLVDR